MIALVDYGLGNIQAFANIYRRLGFPTVQARTPEELEGARKLVLPGVGAFDWAMERLDASGLRATLDRLVLEQKVDVLGICVGMQMMARSSEEGKRPGLGWIDADVVRFDTSHFNHKTQLPHMGWNDIVPTADDTLFRSIASPRYYFLHSYHVVPENKSDVLAIATYAETFAAAIRVGNIYGTQFHPEKSHDWGVNLLRNFAEI
ncbi:imidazole glycerol phosphate synthase subunit HisH [Hyphomicrobium sp. D-2]|uniref:imidazole glycerol phosphate synthase subunit HisH n=1 Tax=Hyphomicrobium sp. D-2 TaxID=3041621 RepID=UPI0024577319|nr:imidazole glycerol phosphate synthase subunit HisH [Hyphomicrobium sp. D-2]MDH4980679.1 imidazole glycerol phosphate synthase subunit HisH [Hyphomicrobium sp. D-2]